MLVGIWFCSCPLRIVIYSPYPWLFWCKPFTIFAFSHAQMRHAQSKDAAQKERALQPFAHAYYFAVMKGINNAYLAAGVVSSRWVSTNKTGRMGKVGAEGRPEVLCGLMKPRIPRSAFAAACVSLRQSNTRCAPCRLAGGKGREDAVQRSGRGCSSSSHRLDYGGWRPPRSNWPSGEGKLVATQQTVGRRGRHVYCASRCHQ